MIAALFVTRKRVLQLVIEKCIYWRMKTCIFVQYTQNVKVQQDLKLYTRPPPFWRPLLKISILIFEVETFGKIKLPAFRNKIGCSFSYRSSELPLIE